MPYKILFFISFLIFCVECRPVDSTVQARVLASPTTESLYDIVFSTPDTGFIVGGRRFGLGIILRTTDGGATWRSDSVYNKGLFALVAVNRHHIEAIGQDGQRVFTENAGALWQYEPHLFWKWAQDMAFFDAENAVVVGGESYGSGVRARYLNGAFLSIDSLPHELHAVAVADNRTAAAVGYGYVCRSDDGGTTWQRLDTRGDNFQSVCFATPKIGFIAGLAGSLWRTDDGGAKWQRLMDGNELWNNYAFRCVSFADAQNGWLCGDGGLVLHTTDGGKNWLSVPNLPKNNFYKIIQKNSSTAFVVGTNGLIAELSF